MGSNLNYAISKVADALGTPAGTYTLGDSVHLLPLESVDGAGAAILRQNRIMYIRDEFGTVGQAVLAQDAGIPYMENAAIAKANYTVDLERKNGVLYIKRVNLATQRQLGGETLNEKRINAIGSLTSRKQLDILRIEIGSGKVIQSSDIFSFEDPTSGETRLVAKPSIDLTDTIAAISSGYHQLAIPYIDPATGNMALLLNTAVAAIELPEQDAFGIGEVLTLFQSLPLGAMASFPVYLYFEQEPVEADIYRSYDLRPLCQPLSRAITPMLTTTSATATTLLAVPVAEGSVVTVNGVVSGLKADASAALGSAYRVTARRATGGNVVLVGSGTITTEEDSLGGSPAVSVTVDVTAQELWLQVAGVSTETWYWRCDEQRVRVMFA